MRILSWVACFGICLTAISTAFAQLPWSSDGMRVADCVPSSGSATSAPVHPAVTKPISVPSFTATLPFHLTWGYLIVVVGSIGNVHHLHFLVDAGAYPSLVDQKIVRDLGRVHCY